MEEILNKYRKWLPREPHLGMIRHSLLHGWAYIEMDENKGIPFYINNHGGKIPLQDVRWEPSIGGSESMSVNEKEGNIYGTICDTVDALLDNKTSIDLTKIKKFVDDIRDMLLRMKKRETEVKRYISEMNTILNSIENTQPFNDKKINETIGMFETMLIDDIKSEDIIQKIGKDIKEEAASLEENLRKQMVISLKIGELLNRIKGERNWDKELMKKQGII